MRFIEAKKILSNWYDGDNWFGCNYTINIYKGCNHGCIYCDSRSECYRIDSFDEVRGKANLLNLLEKELQNKRKKGIITTGAMGDPYNLFEKRYQLTRGALQLMNRYGYGVSLLTKSDLVVRDIDILKMINQHSPAMVKFTITTFSEDLREKIEPNVTSTTKRLEALKTISIEGILTGVHIWPILPYINDTEENIYQIVKASAESGSSFVVPYFGVTLRQNQRIYFYHQLDKFFPGIKEKYINSYGSSYECLSKNEKKLWEVLKEVCRKYGLLYKMKDIKEAFKGQHQQEQITLF